MELTKRSKYTESETLFSSEEEKVTMGIDLEAMSHIINKLTNLYSNPIEATVREVISNAIDTTKRLPEVSRKPIIVTLPTELNREFIVKDLGEGMSKDTLEKVFSQYGASTKRDDMTQIGAHGLGAKAPLSYCSQFIVESVKDGERNIIVLSSEEDGNYARFEPTEKTSDPNGTTVMIPVREDDTDKFKDAAEVYTYCSFHTEIEFVNGIYHGVPEVTYLGKARVGGTDENPLELEIYKEDLNFDELLTHYMEENASSFEYSVSGWLYNKSKSYSYYRSSRGKFIVDLIPGLVDFDSSRDEITNNHRFETLEKTMSEEISNVLASYIEEQIKSENLTEDEVFNLFRNKMMSRTHSRATEHMNKFLLSNTLNSGKPLLSVFQYKSGIELDFMISNYRGEQSTLLHHNRKYNEHASDTFIFAPGYEMTRGEVKSAIENDEAHKIDLSLLSLTTKKIHTAVIVTDTQDEKDTMNVFRRSNSFLKNEDIERQYSQLTVVGSTKATYDEVVAELENVRYPSSANFEVVTYENYKEAVSVIKSTRKKKAENTIEMSTYTVEYTEEPMTKLLFDDNDVTAEYRMREINLTELYKEKKDSIKLFIVSNYSYSSTSFFYINAEKLSKKHKKDVLVTCVRAKAVTLNNYQTLLENSDYVHVASGTFAAAKVRETFNELEQFEIERKVGLTTSQLVLSDASQFNVFRRPIESAVKSIPAIKKLFNYEKYEAARDLFYEDRELIEDLRYHNPYEIVEEELDPKVQLIKDIEAYVNENPLVDDIRLYHDFRFTGLNKLFIKDMIKVLK